MASGIGLDIGTTGVRVVETTSNARSIRVRRAYALPLEASVFRDGHVHDAAGLTAALRLLAREARIGNRPVQISVGSHPAVLVRAAQVDYLPNKADRNALVEEKANRVMPLAASEMYLDHHVARVFTTPREDGTSRTDADVAIAGIVRNDLDAILDCVIHAGINPRTVDVTTFAIARMISRANSTPNALNVFVHLGATTVTVSGLHKNQFVYQKPINLFSGSQLTQDLADSFLISLEEAEVLKRTSQTVRTSAFDASANDPTPLIAQWTTALVREISACVDELTSAVGRPVSHVWLSGGGARFTTLSSYLSARLPHSPRVSMLYAHEWVSNPDLLLEPALADHDLTAALAASLE